MCLKANEANVEERKMYSLSAWRFQLINNKLNLRVSWTFFFIKKELQLIITSERV